MIPGDPRAAAMPTTVDATDRPAVRSTSRSASRSTRVSAMAALLALLALALLALAASGLAAAEAPGRPAAAGVLGVQPCGHHDSLAGPGQSVEPTLEPTSAATP
jgi:hypothetical protein